METGVKLPGKDEWSKPCERLQDYPILLYGREKIGKTSLAAQFPDTLFLMCEPGGKALRLKQCRVRNWSDFLAYSKLLESTKEFRTVVVDTVDLAAKYAMSYACKKLGIQHPSEEEWGKGWERARDEWAFAIMRICSYDRGIIFISHEKETEIQTRAGRKHNLMVPSLVSWARAVLEPVVDIIAYFRFDIDNNRELVLRGDDSIVAGHRLQKNFIGIDTVPMGKNAQEGYAAFVEAFANHLQKKGGKKESDGRIIVRK